MFTSVSARSASAYKRVSVETAVDSASPHQLVNMLFDALLTSLSGARTAMAKGDVGAKGEHIAKAVRILDEGLKPALNVEQGGDLALNLKGLYGFCVMQLTEANLKNDAKIVNDVIRVIEPLAQGWKEIASQVSN